MEIDKSTILKKGDIVIRSYHHDPVEWGIVIDFEVVDVDPRNRDDESMEEMLKYTYVTVLWPGDYTTQEADYELWTYEEALSHGLN